MSTHTPQHADPGSRKSFRRRLVDQIRLRLWIVVAVTLVLMAVYVVLGRQLMLLVPEFKQPVIEQLESRLGLSVQIDQLSGEMDGLTPLLRVEGVRLGGDGQISPLSLDRVEVSLDVLPSLLHRTVRIRRLFLSGIQINVEQQNNGKLRLTGLELLNHVKLPAVVQPPADSSESKKNTLKRVLDMLYHQKRLEIADARLQVKLQDYPQIVAPNVNILLVNNGTDHRLALSGQLQESVADAPHPVSVQLRLHLLNDAFELDQLTGKVWMELKGEHIEQWLNPFVPAPYQLQNVNGSVALWSFVDKGKPANTVADVLFRSLQMYQQDIPQPLQVDEFSTRIWWLPTPGKQHVQVENLSFFTQDFANFWPATDVALTWYPPAVAPAGAPALAIRETPAVTIPDTAAGDETGEQHHAADEGVLSRLGDWRLQVNQLSLSALHGLLRDMPLRHDALPVDALTARLDGMNPTGQITDIQLSGQGRSLHAFQARGDTLNLDPVGKTPGARNVSLWLSGSPDKGVAHIQHDQLELHMPASFYQPLSGQASVPLRWQRNAQGEVRLDSGKFTIKNEDVMAAGLLAVTKVPEQPAYVSLVGKMVQGDVAAAPRYIPLKSDKIKGGAEHWLANAFKGGVLTAGWFLHEGPVVIDLSRQQERTLQLRFDVVDSRMQFLDGWPDAENLEASVLMNGREILSHDVRATILGSRIQNVDVHIPSYIPGEVPRLKIGGAIQGPASDVGAILQTTPLAERIPDELQYWQFQAGEVDAYLSMDWPLAQGDTAPAALQTHGQLKQGQLFSATRQLEVDALEGAFRYSIAEGLQVPTLTGHALNYPVQATVATEQGTTTLTVDGQAALDNVADWLEMGWLHPASGVTDYRFQVQAGGGRPARMRLHSSLKNITLDAPPPLGKRAQDVWPLSLDWTAQNDQARMQISLADTLSGSLLLKEGSLYNGHILLGDGELPVLQDVAEARGLLVTGTLDQVHSRQWLDFIERFQTGLEGASTGTKEAATAASPISKVLLSVERLNLFDLPVRDGLLQISRETQGWKVELDSASVQGKVTVPDAFTLRGNHPLRIDVNRLILTTNEMPELGQADGATALSPMALPVAVVNLRGVVVDQEAMGEWRFRIHPDERGVRFSDVQAAWRYMLLEGKGYWHEQEGEQRSHFEGRAATASIQKVLNAFELEPLLEGNDAYSLLNIDWPGSPLDIGYNTVHGNASLEIGRSRITEVNRSASALRVLGVLNVGTLSRRLRFDFSDLYKKGMVCDRISGDFVLNGPWVSTSNLHIKSPSAEFRIQGEMNLDTEMLNHQVEVMLPVSSNLFVGCIAGPAACAGILVVDRLWGDRLEKMATLGYRVTGSWDDPKVKEQ